VTGQAITFTNWGSGEPNNASGLEHVMQFRSDFDAEGRLWNDAQNSSYRSYVVEYEPAIVNDWYFVHLDAGQKASVVLAQETGAGNTDLALVCTMPWAPADRRYGCCTNVDEAILDFVAPEDGNYYMRVSGSSPSQYDLC